MRVLPGRPDHASGIAPQDEAQAHRPRYRRSHAGQHLPLRHLSTDPRSHQNRSGSKSMNRIELSSRRDFLSGIFSAGAVIFAAGIAPNADADVTKTTWNPGVFLGIDTDGSVTIVAHRSEMGTGIRTSLP